MEAIGTDRIAGRRVLKIVADKYLKNQTDGELISQLGDEPDALGYLYDRYGSLVYAIALRVTKDPTVAEDIVNDVFLQLWRKPSAFDETRGKLPSWLTVITRNKAVDQLRRMPIQPEIALEDAPQPDMASTAKTFFAADFEKARRIMNQLPAEQRAALELAYLDGLTQSEISTRLREPLGTVKSRIRIGLSVLRKALA